VGGGPSIGVPPGRGGHTSVQVATSALGLGGLLVLGGASEPWGRPNYGSCVHGPVKRDVGNAGALLLVICRDCALPMASFPSTTCRHIRRTGLASPVGAGLACSVQSSGKFDGENFEDRPDLEDNLDPMCQPNECRLYCPDYDW
jgi:hypothetical protein